MVTINLSLSLLCFKFLASKQPVRLLPANGYLWLRNIPALLHHQLPDWHHLSCQSPLPGPVWPAAVQRKCCCFFLPQKSWVGSGVHWGGGRGVRVKMCVCGWVGEEGVFFFLEGSLPSSLSPFMSIMLPCPSSSKDFGLPYLDISHSVSQCFYSHMWIKNIIHMQWVRVFRAFLIVHSQGGNNSFY